MKKLIAFYLPQYHSIPENDKWWGKGFTEWTNVRKTKPVFRRHQQPEVPLNNNYYCLLDEKTQKWQAQLAKKYGIYGFCYYHYWFEGKLLLEKPMEKMLLNKDIDIPFCICWANETWSRTWNGQEKNILIKQNYSENIEDWTKHFEYLLPFFRDSRYILHKNKPMIIIYKPHLMNKCKEMIKLWDDLAKKEGFDGIYVGGQHHTIFDYDRNDIGIEFRIEFEPFFTVKELIKEVKSFRGMTKYVCRNPRWLISKIKSILFRTSIIFDYDEIWRRSLERIPYEENDIAGAFPAWDNTPRKGKSSVVFFQATPKKFEKYFKEKLEQADKYYKSEYIFINAWNEWAEGAHLEPDERNIYGYLEGIKSALE